MKAYDIIYKARKALALISSRIQMCVYVANTV